MLLDRPMSTLRAHTHSKACMPHSLISSSKETEMTIPLAVYRWVRSRIAGHLDDTITTAALQSSTEGNSLEAAVSVETNASNTEC